MSDLIELSNPISGLHHYAGDPTQMKLRLVLTDLAALYKKPDGWQQLNPNRLQQCQVGQNDYQRRDDQARYILQRSTSDTSPGWTIQPDVKTSPRDRCTNTLVGVLEQNGFHLRVSCEPASRISCSNYNCINAAKRATSNGSCVSKTNSSYNGPVVPRSDCQTRANNGDDPLICETQPVASGAIAKSSGLTVNQQAQQRRAATNLIASEENNDFQQNYHPRNMSEFWLVKRRRARNWKDTSVVTSVNHVSDYLKRANARKPTTTALSTDTSAKASPSGRCNLQDAANQLQRYPIGPLHMPCRCSSNSRAHSLIKGQGSQLCSSSIGNCVCSDTSNLNSSIDSCKIPEALISECHGVATINSSPVICSCRCRCSELSDHYRKFQALNLLRPSSEASKEIRIGQRQCVDAYCGMRDGYAAHESTLDARQTIQQTLPIVSYSRDLGSEDLSLLDLLDVESDDQHLFKLGGAELAGKLAQSIRNGVSDGPIFFTKNLDNPAAVLKEKNHHHNREDEYAYGPQVACNCHAIHGEIVKIILEKRKPRVAASGGVHSESVKNSNTISSVSSKLLKDAPESNQNSALGKQHGTSGWRLDQSKSNNAPTLSSTHSTDSAHYGDRQKLLNNETTLSCDKNMTLGQADGQLPTTISADNSDGKLFNDNQEGNTSSMMMINLAVDCLTESKSQQSYELNQSLNKSNVAINNGDKRLDLKLSPNKSSDDPSCISTANRTLAPNTTSTSTISTRPEVGPYNMIDEIRLDGDVELKQQSTALEHSICLSVIVIDVFNKLIQLKPDLNQRIVVDLGVNIKRRLTAGPEVAAWRAVDTIESSSNQAHDTGANSDSVLDCEVVSNQQHEQRQRPISRAMLKFNSTSSSSMPAKLLFHIELVQAASDRVVAEEELGNVRMKFGLMMQRLWKPIREFELVDCQHRNQNHRHQRASTAAKPQLVELKGRSPLPDGFMSPINGCVLIKLQFNIHFASEFSNDCESLYVKYKLLAPKSSHWRLKKLQEVGASTAGQLSMRRVNASELLNTRQTMSMTPSNSGVKLEHVTHVIVGRNKSRTMSNLNQNRFYDDDEMCLRVSSDDDRTIGYLQNLAEGLTITSAPDSSGHFHFACSEQVALELSPILMGDDNFYSNSRNVNNAKSNDKLLLSTDQRNSTKSRASIRRQKSFQELGDDSAEQLDKICPEIDDDDDEEEDDGPILDSSISQSIRLQSSTTRAVDNSGNLTQKFINSQKSCLFENNSFSHVTKHVNNGLNSDNNNNVDGTSYTENKSDDKTSIHNEYDNKPNASDLKNGSNNVVNYHNGGDINKNKDDDNITARLTFGNAHRMPTTCNDNKSNINNLYQQDAIYEIIILLEVYSSNFYLDKFQGWSYLSVPINLTKPEGKDSTASNTYVNHNAAHSHHDSKATNSRCSSTRELTILRPALQKQLDKLRYYLTGRLPNWFPSPQSLLASNGRYLLQTEQSGKVLVDIEVTSQYSDPEFDSALRHLIAGNESTMSKQIGRSKVVRPYDNRKRMLSKQFGQIDRLAGFNDAGRSTDSEVGEIIEAYKRAKTRIEQLDVTSLLNVI